MYANKLNVYISLEQKQQQQQHPVNKRTNDKMKECGKGGRRKRKMKSRESSFTFFFSFIAHRTAFLSGLFAYFAFLSALPRRKEGWKRSLRAHESKHHRNIYAVTANGESTTKQTKN